MSVTSSSQPSPLAGDSRVAGPWRKVAIWTAIIIAFLAILILFSGRMDLLRRSRPQPEPAKVQMNTNIAPLVRPVEPVMAPPAPLPRIATPRVAQALPSGGDNQKKAFESSIGAYSIRPNTGSTTTKAAATPDDPGDNLPADSRPDALETSLKPTHMDGTRVAELPDPRWLIEQGRVLPCIQQTRIDSTLPGAVTAIIPESIRGETGDVTVMPKGARVFGTIQHALLNGADRLAVLWQNFTTPVLYDDRGMPHQFRIAVNSPASSELGETGLDGDVDRHLAKKIGGIIGLSLIQGGIQAGIAAAQQNRGTQINLNSIQNGGNCAADELLRSWIEIPDVMHRDQGLACGIYVIRDLDMRGAYRLTQRYRNGP